MNAVDAVKLAFLTLEIVCAVILAGFMSRALDLHPVRAMLRGAEILAFMILAILPAPRVPGRHGIRRRSVTA